MALIKVNCDPTWRVLIKTWLWYDDLFYQINLMNPIFFY